MVDLGRTTEGAGRNDGGVDYKCLSDAVESLSNVA